MRNLVVVILLFITGCSKPNVSKIQSNELGDMLEIIEITPAELDKLNTGTRVNVYFRYKIASKPGAYLWVRPYKDGRDTDHYSANASPLYPKGSDVASGFFEMDSPGSADELRIRMCDKDQKEFFHLSYDINAEWQKW